jgi:hypothetical protein
MVVDGGGPPAEGVGQVLGPQGPEAASRSTISCLVGDVTAAIWSGRRIQ